MLRLHFLHLCVLFVAVQTGHSTCPERCLCDTITNKAGCGAAGFTQVPQNVAQNNQLRMLDLKSNHIKEIASVDVPYPSLEFLDLSNNELDTIEDGAFQGLVHLQYLFLDYNQLGNISSGMFQGLQSLLEIDMSNNKLKHLGDDIFADLNKLEGLDLSGNRLEKIEENAFMGLSSLTKLNLDDNRLLQLPSFTHLPHLSSLSMSYNQLEEIPSYAFRAVRDLRMLSLAANSIMQVSIQAFHNGDTTNSPQVPKLETLDLQNNKLQRVPLLQNLRNLVEIKLSQNPIGEVESGAFQGSELVNLHTIHLSLMPELSVVKRQAFQGLSSLRSVFLNSNHKLQEIEVDAFVSCKDLNEVDLHGNALESLEPNLFQWANLSRLDLSYNKWLCDCNLAWLKDVLKNYHDNSSHPMLSQVRCAQPTTLASKRVADVPKDNFVCGNDPDAKANEFEDTIMIGIFAGTSCILLLMGGILIYKYRASMCEQTQPGVDVYSYFVYHNPNRLARHHKIPPRRLQAKPRDPNRRLRHVSWSTDLNNTDPPAAREQRLLTQTEVSSSSEAPASAATGDARNV